MIAETNYAVAIVTIRLIAGFLFFFQGYDKVIRIGMSEIQRTFKIGFENHNIPGPVVSFMAVFTSWVELICGFILILGLFKYYAIYLLCFSLILVVIGFSFTKPMWENNHVFVRLILLITLLITPVDWDKFSLDYLLALSRLTV